MRTDGYKRNESLSWDNIRESVTKTYDEKCYEKLNEKAVHKIIKPKKWSLGDERKYALTEHLEYTGKPDYRHDTDEFIESMNFVSEKKSVPFEQWKNMFKMKEARVNSAEVLMYFRTKADRDKAFSALLAHDEYVYKCDAHYTPSFPGSDGKGACDRAIVIYTPIYEDVKSEVGDFVEDMESIAEVDCVEFEYNPLQDRIDEKSVYSKKNDVLFFIIKDNEGAYWSEEGWTEDFENAEAYESEDDADDVIKGTITKGMMNQEELFGSKYDPNSILQQDEYYDYVDSILDNYDIVAVYADHFHETIKRG